MSIKHAAAALAIAVVTVIGVGVPAQADDDPAPCALEVAAMPGLCLTQEQYDYITATQAKADQYAWAQQQADDEALATAVWRDRYQTQSVELQAAQILAANRLVRITDLRVKVHALRQELRGCTV